MLMRFDSVSGIDGAGFGCRGESNLQRVRHVRMDDDMRQKYIIIIRTNSDEL